MSEHLVIERRFRGPPASANGGYACGLVAGLVGGTAECTLRAPPPLDTPLDVERAAGGKVVVRHGDLVVAEGAPAVLELEVPDAVDVTTATQAAKAFVGFTQHLFPGCFVCGPERHDGDALRIFPGAVPGRRVAAAPWIPDTSFADADGVVRPEILWAALDCPSWFGVTAFEPFAGTALLGRLAAEIITRPRAGQRTVALGWLLGREGRKILGGSALLAEDGTVLARARATWIQLK